MIQVILNQGGAIGRGKEPPLVRTLWSCSVLPRILHPPRAPQSGPSSQSGPSTSSAVGAGGEPELPANTVTWESSPDKWRQPLPAYHRK